MKTTEQQSQKSVESFGWQWVSKTVKDSKKNFYRRLFRDVGIYSNYFDNKEVGYFGSGGGRHVWAINELSNPKKFILSNYLNYQLLIRKLILIQKK